MNDKEKALKLKVAYDAITTVFNDTDESLWANKYLTDAIVALDNWFEESEV